MRSSYDSLFGTIRSDWRRGEGGVTYRIGIPGGSVATLYIFASASAKITEGGKRLADAAGVRHVRDEGGAAVLALASGDYEFSASER